MYATKIPSDERSLVLRLIEGEEDAFCELYAAYKNRFDILCYALFEIALNMRKIFFRMLLQ